MEGYKGKTLLRQSPSKFKYCDPNLWYTLEYVDGVIRVVNGGYEKKEFAEAWVRGCKACQSNKKA